MLYLCTLFANWSKDAHILAVVPFGCKAGLALKSVVFKDITVLLLVLLVLALNLKSWANVVDMVDELLKMSFATLLLEGAVKLALALLLGTDGCCANGVENAFVFVSKLAFGLVAVCCGTCCCAGMLH
uniref:Putative THOC5 family protein n=1 Tax=Lygus hesperus TaxID=30085 RepID=A0A0A9Y904_LYGHE